MSRQCSRAAYEKENPNGLLWMMSVTRAALHAAFYTRRQRRGYLACGEPMLNRGRSPIAPKTIAVVTSSPPMAEVGTCHRARAHARPPRAGHDANISSRRKTVWTPASATWRLLTDVRHRGRAIDQVSLRYPSYPSPSEPRVLLNHTMRGITICGRSQRDAQSARPRQRARAPDFPACDRSLLLTNKSTKLFVQSRTSRSASRCGRRCARRFVTARAQRAYRRGYGPSFLFVSRLTRLKRADLVIRALATGDGAGIAAVIAGDGEERGPLERLASELGVANRVTFPGRLDDQQLVGHLARCRAVVFPPFQEDYGFVTAEAFASRKAVLTCRDSGGPSELVKDGVNGLIVEPTPDALGRAMRRLADDAALAERMGTAAFEAARPSRGRKRKVQDVRYNRPSA